jgi:hypothetical protein
MRLIQEPVKDTVGYQKTVPERIYRLTSGQPFYAQVICQNLIDVLNVERRNRVLVADLEKVVSDLSENPLPQMSYLWESLEPEEQIMLALLGEVLDNPDSYATVDKLIKFATSNKLDIEMSQGEMEQVLSGLFGKELLDRERVAEGKNEYRYKADLFRHWIRREHSIWKELAM